MNQGLLRKCAGTFLSAVLFAQTAMPTAHAQLVQVRPGFVKAPLVRVYWGPDGSSYVRAPFVGVYTPGYVAAPYRQMPDCQRMSWQELARAISESARQLDADLTQMPSSEIWRSRLKTVELAALTPPDPRQPPTGEMREQLGAALAGFDNLDGVEGADRVGSLNNFRFLRIALREYLAPPEQHLRRQTASAANDLNASLLRFQTGPGWQRYLALPPEVASANSNTDVQGSLPQVSDLAATLERFDKVSHDDAYRVISELPAFRATHQSLSAYATWVQSNAAGSAAEELPAPAPQR